MCWGAGGKERTHFVEGLEDSEDRDGGLDAQLRGVCSRTVLQVLPVVDDAALQEGKYLLP